MGKRKVKTLTCDGWITRSRDSAVLTALKDDKYLPVYRQLLSHIESLPTPMTMVHAVSCVHMVYGWMPTILDPLGVSNVVEENADQLLAVVNATRCAKKPELGDDELSLLSRFANNSTVGASKLVHFLNPRVYAIWDSRVADRYLWRGVSRDTFNDIGRFREYTNTLWDWSRRPIVAAACADLMKACPNAGGCSPVRLMELVLFHPSLLKKAANNHRELP